MTYGDRARTVRRIIQMDKIGAREAFNQRYRDFMMGMLEDVSAEFSQEMMTIERDLKGFGMYFAGYSPVDIKNAPALNIDPGLSAEIFNGEDEFECLGRSITIAYEEMDKFIADIVNLKGHMDHCMRYGHASESQGELPGLE